MDRAGEPLTPSLNP